MLQFIRGCWTGSVALLFANAAFFVLPLAAAPPGTPESLKSRVRELHAKGNGVKVTMSDKTVIRGQIVRVAEDSFTIREEKGARETSVPFAQLKDVGKTGMSRRAKAILIPAAIAGGAVLVLCAAPYPIGFLCRKDPS